MKNMMYSNGIIEFLFNELVTFVLSLLILRENWKYGDEKQKFTINHKRKLFFSFELLENLKVKMEILDVIFQVE